MQNKIYIPQGKFADAAADKRRELREKLLNGGRTVVAKDGNVMNAENGEAKITIPKGKLADAAADKRAELRRKLLSGGNIKVGTGGNVTNTDNGETKISIPKGKLAVQQWYEKNPDLLQAEQVAMNTHFPGFELQKLDDGRLAWVGKLDVGVYESKYGVKKEYNVMAVYLPNHPYKKMGSSVYVYPILPDADELREEFRQKFNDPHILHLLYDSDSKLSYLCTTEEGYTHDGSDNVVTTAASVMAWAVKWFMSYELVLTGDLEREKFNQHHGV